MEQTNERIVLSIAEAQRVGICKCVVKKIMTAKEAAEELGLSHRQTQRIVARYRAGGASGACPPKPRTSVAVANSRSGEEANGDAMLRALLGLRSHIRAGTSAYGRTPCAFRRDVAVMACRSRSQ